MNIVDKRFEEVYCADCKHWDNLHTALLNNESVTPSPCCVCYPYDTEDSVARVRRWKYEEER